jgi:transcriptional regulator with XRE-family HTH domain
MSIPTKPGVKPGRRATIIDIARQAGVSPKTVSRVMNDEPHVKQSVRDEIKAIARALNYQPNVMAQGLIARKSYLIGLTYERPSPSYVVELQRGALERLAGERYRLIVLPLPMPRKTPKGWWRCCVRRRWTGWCSRRPVRIWSRCSMRWTPSACPMAGWRPARSRARRLRDDG